MARRKFTAEYKRTAVQPLLAGTKGVTELARELGIGRTMLQRWVSEQLAKGEDAFPGSGQQAGAEARIAELERRLRATEMERDILKKAVACFSKDQP